MPALKPTAFAGRLTWLGRVDDRGAGLVARAVPRLGLDFDGITGAAHAGAVRASCARVTAQHPRGTPIRNTRQLSLMSREELDEIALRMGIDALDPGLLGTNLLLEGLPDLSRLPPSSRLQGPDGVTLVIDMENRACTLPQRPIEAVHPGAGAAFRRAAHGRRGVTAWVERPGVLALGETLRLHVPDQPAWPHLGLARRG